MDDIKYVVSAAPHIRDKSSTGRIMLDVIIALTPAALFKVYFFGINALLITILTIISCIFFEYIFQKIRKQKSTIYDGSAVVTGLLLALLMPASSNFGLPIAGSFFAIVIVKQLFGGIGVNFLNPALGAMVFLIMSFPNEMRITPQPINYFADLDHVYVSAIVLLLGGLYLLIRKIISWRIPVFFILSTALLVWIFGGEGVPIFELLSGGLILGAFFMATDYSTSPVTPVGKIIMGVGCGFITALMHVFGNASEGMIYAILFMNLVVPLIDRFTKPTTLGKTKTKEGET